jgi:hypothetical protein
MPRKEHQILPRGLCVSRVPLRCGRYYASPELVIDTFYPPLYALSRGLALWWLTMPGRVREAPLPLKVSEKPMVSPRGHRSFSILTR